MKETIRRGLFETNSSSTHSIVMCSSDEYNKWRNEDVYYDRWNEKFVEENDSILKARECESYDQAYGLYISDKDNEFYSDCYHRFLTWNEFFNDYDLETFEDEYTTKSGETIVAFGYYGYN